MKIIHLSLLLATSALAMPAFAQTQDADLATQALPAAPQDAAADAAADPAATDVVVTGSRIRRPDLVSSSPTTTVAQEDLKITGTQNVEEYLNTLPQLVAGATKSTNVAGTADGTASLNLRGLGAKRTLVLVNGRRFVASNLEGVVDVNNIPAALLDRVEVVTGGASAVYGSDAMAGVVNFILKDKFDGLQLDGQYGISDRGDAANWSTSMTVGASGERAHAWLHITHEDRKLVRGSDRDLSRFSLLDNNGVFQRTGTAGRLGGTLIGIPTPNGSGGFVNRDYALDNLVPRPFITATDTNYDLGGEGAIQTPLNRTNIFARGVYELSDTVRAFTELGFNHVSVSAALSRTAPNIRQTTNAPGLPANASFITPQIRALLNARPDPTAPFALRFATPLDFPERYIDFDRDLYRVLVGVEGKLGGNWDWSAAYSYSHLATKEVQVGDISRRTFVEASTPSATDPTRCASSNPRCVLVTSLTNWSPALVDFLRVDNISTTEVSESIASANLTGSLLTLPGGSLGIAVGAEYRKVESRDDPAPVLLDFVSAGFGERNRTAGSFDVKEVYGEAVIPILSGLSFADYLGLEVAGRYSDYSSAGSIFTYKAGGEWRITPAIRLRGLYQRAVRAPNINELFGGLVNTYPAMIDPCSRTANPTGNVAALCVAQGVPAGVLGSYQQNGAAIEARLVSNPNLNPEKSDTLTLGAVLTPGGIPGFNVTVDYYDIRIKNAIERLAGGAQGVLSSCFESNDVNSVFCRTFTRSRTTYEIIDWGVPLANVATLRTSGVDAAVNYGWKWDGLGLGGNPARLRVGLFGTWVQRNVFQANPNARAIDRVGTVGGDTPAIPEWRATGLFNYGSGGFGLSWQVEYLSSVKDRRFANAILAGSANPRAGIANPVVNDYFYHNVRVSYDLGKFQLFAGARNLFDKQAPLLSSPIEQNTDGNTYDVIGRYLFSGVTLKF